MNPEKTAVEYSGGEQVKEDQGHFAFFFSNPLKKGDIEAKKELTTYTASCPINYTYTVEKIVEPEVRSGVPGELSDRLSVDVKVSFPISSCNISGTIPLHVYVLENENIDDAIRLAIGNTILETKLKSEAS